MSFSFVRHGIPVLAGIGGTNPAGGGYQAISPTILIAHKDANIAVGGVGIVSGMSPEVLPRDQMLLPRVIKG